MHFSKEDTTPEYIQLAYLTSKKFTKQQKCYMHLAYWAISLANMDDSGEGTGQYEVLMKKFVYIFIVDLGISPFVKCYNKRSMI